MPISGPWLSRNGVYWVAEWRDEKGRSRRRGLGSREKVSKAQAMRKLRELTAELGNGGSAGQGARTLSQWIDEYLGLIEPDYTPRAYANTKKTGEYLTERIGADIRVDAVDPADADDFYSWLRKEFSFATARSHIQQSKAIFRRLVLRREIQANPFEHLSGGSVSVEKDAPPTSDVDRLIDAAGPQWQPLVALCALAGLRRGEAMLLTWADVKWGEGRLSVPQPKTARKTGRPRRWVRMEPRLESILLDAHETAMGERVVWRGPNNLHRGMVALMNRAGVAWDDPFHGLRRWRSITWKAAYPEYVVDAWLGHSASTARKHYNSVVPEGFYAAPCFGPHASYGSFFAPLMPLGSISSPFLVCMIAPNSVLRD